LSVIDAAKRMALYDVKTGRPVEGFQPPVGAIWRAVFSPDGRRMAWVAPPSTPGRDASVIVLECASGKELARFDVAPFFLPGLAFSDDGQTLRGLGQNAEGEPWIRHECDVESGTTRLAQAFVFPGYKAGLRIADKGNRAVWRVDGTDDCVVWDIDAGTEAARVSRIGKPRVATMDLSPDGETLYLSRLDGVVEAWSVAPSRLIREYSIVLNQHSIQSNTTDATGRIALSQTWETRRTVSHALADLARYVWRPRAGVPNFRLEAVVWEVQSGRVIARFPIQSHAVLSPDGRSVASDHDGKITVWEIPR
jgi:WD40 repeat protein